MPQRPFLFVSFKLNSVIYFVFYFVALATTTLLRWLLLLLVKVPSLLFQDCQFSFEDVILLMEYILSSPCSPTNMVVLIFYYHIKITILSSGFCQSMICVLPFIYTVSFVTALQYSRI